MCLQRLMSSPGFRRYSIAVSALGEEPPSFEPLTQLLRIMEEINNIEVGPCTESNYLKPSRVHYSQVSEPEPELQDAVG